MEMKSELHNRILDYPPVKSVNFKMNLNLSVINAMNSREDWQKVTMASRDTKLNLKEKLLCSARKMKG